MEYPISWETSGGGFELTQVHFTKAANYSGAITSKFPGQLGFPSSLQQGYIKQRAQIGKLGPQLLEMHRSNPTMGVCETHTVFTA